MSFVLAAVSLLALTLAALLAVYLVRLSYSSGFLLKYQGP